MKVKKVLGIVLLSAVMFGAGFGVLALVLRPLPLHITNVPLEQVADGTYTGVCQNKILFAVTEVSVKEHKIDKIDVVWHKESYMPQAKAVARQVCEQQSLDIDNMSGATFTCDTVRGAIQNALSKGIAVQ